MGAQLAASQDRLSSAGKVSCPRLLVFKQSSGLVAV
jgi:hypothetical protein